MQAASKKREFFLHLLHLLTHPPHFFFFFFFFGTRNISGTIKKALLAFNWFGVLTVMLSPRADVIPVVMVTGEQAAGSAKSAPGSKGKGGWRGEPGEEPGAGSERAETAAIARPASRLWRNILKRSTNFKRTYFPPQLYRPVSQLSGFEDSTVNLACTLSSTLCLKQSNEADLEPSQICVLD
nr:uncharacterized protein LOC125183012 isoform X2 [Anser cygnoides]